MSCLDDDALPAQQPRKVTLSHKSSLLPPELLRASPDAATRHFDALLPRATEVPSLAGAMQTQQVAVPHYAELMGTDVRAINPGS